MAENEILQSTAVDENNDYNASEIQVLEGLEAVRKRCTTSSTKLWITPSTKRLRATARKFK